MESSKDFDNVISTNNLHPEKSLTIEKSQISNDSQILAVRPQEPLEAELNNTMSEEKKKSMLGIQWYYAPAFLLFWAAIFFAIILPIFFYLPEGQRKQNEASQICGFIAERAESILIDFDAIGPKVVGSFANENQTVELLIREINKVQSAMNQELFELELDIQIVSGAYIHWTMVNMYQGVQNVVVKLKPKNSTSESYLLINSHFDSKPGSPGSGDDGAMVVIMLEILRVLATGNCAPFVHPIVFLFNGAEENPLQASHGFITQHKWAKNCKALINLDSAGSGHREIMFQSGPNHPWLMNYYRKHVRRPFATSFAEELFQSGILPSDTDFRIFRDYGHVPGLDFAHSYNGYVYHTEFDKADVIPLGTLQITGDHILALAHAFGNAPELEDPSKYAEGHTIFYDFLGLFFVYYTETEGTVIDIIVSLAAFVVPAISMWRFSKQASMPLTRVLRCFALIFPLHLIGFALAFLLPILIAVLYDLDNRSMTWFTNKWLVIGQYVCPSLFGLTMPTLVYLSFQKSEHQLPKSFRVQMALHSQAIILAILCIVSTSMGVRTSYMPMVSIFFYVCASIINLITCLQNRGFLWIIPLMISQIMPFLYFTYLIHALLCTLIPMLGRFDTITNPDLVVAAMCALGTVLSMGFIIPVLSAFRRPKSILISLVVVTFIFAMMSLTHLGFPYRPKTSVGRFSFLHVNRVFYDFNKSVERSEFGYYFNFEDRRVQHPIEDYIDLTNLESIDEDCKKYMMCGLPIFNHRWYKARFETKWLPSATPFVMPGKAALTLARRTLDAKTSTARFEFTLSGPSHMSIFVRPLEGGIVTDWSFLKNMLEDRDEWQPPYHIFFSYGKDNSPLNFYIDIQRTNGQFDGPIFELGISSHFVSKEYARDLVAEEFTSKFPDYSYVMDWPSLYERYIF